MKVTIEIQHEIPGDDDSAVLIMDETDPVAVIPRGSPGYRALWVLLHRADPRIAAAQQQVVQDLAGLVNRALEPRFSAPIAAKSNASGVKDFGDYTAIERRIMQATNRKSIAITDREFLCEERVFIMERGKEERAPSPAELYSGDALFREFIDQCIQWQLQNAQNSSSRVSVNAIVKTISNYTRPKTGWYDWLKRRLTGNHAVPPVDTVNVRSEIIPPRKTSGSGGAS